MNQTAKNLIRVVGVVAGLAAAAWALRDRLLPAPEIHHEEPPPFRQAPDESLDTVGGPGDAGDDLTVIKGIGPVTASKLEDAGITTLDELASADASEVAGAIGSSESTVAGWIAAAGSSS